MAYQIQEHKMQDVSGMPPERQARMRARVGQSREMHPLNCAAISCIPTKWLRGNSGLTRVEIALLAYVLEHPGCALNRSVLAEECGCAPNSIPRAAKKLEAMGLIERETQPGKPMIYRAGRNLDVTPPRETRNLDVTGNMDVTPCAPTRNANVTTLDMVGSNPEQTTTPMVVTDVTTTRNIPPQTPLGRISFFLSNSDREESSLEGGLGGGLFGAAPPAAAPTPAPTSAKAKPKRRARREKFYAAEATMPAEPNPAMVEYAAAKGMRNGTLAEQHRKFRGWHIRAQTLIACLEQRWETWVDNWSRTNPMRPEGGAPAGYRLGGIGPDGKQRYLKIQTNNVYR